MKNAAKNLAAKVGIDIDLHTIKGAAWSNGIETDYVNAFKVEPRRATGAGDCWDAAAIGDKKGDILTALESWIIDRCRTLDTNGGGVNGPRKILDEYQGSVDRLAQLINRKLITCVKRDRDGRIVFSRQIIVELERFGVKQLDLHSLADAIPGAGHMKSDGCKVVKCSMENLTNFFSPPQEEPSS